MGCGLLVFQGALRMRFEGRELKPYAEPVSVSKLTRGSVYFAVTYVDDQMLMPMVEPIIFAGQNLDAGDVGSVIYFQDAASYRQGIRHESPARGGDATFFAALESEIKHIFEYESALDELLRCALRRRKMAEDGPA